jgi:hypothetical protein
MAGLKSRKFWAGLVGTVLMVVLVQGVGLDAEVALAIISPLIFWIFGEAYVDGKRASSGE